MWQLHRSQQRRLRRRQARSLRRQGSKRHERSIKGLESLAVTLKNPAFVDKMKQLSGGEPSTSGLVTIKYSNWLMSIVLAQQPHFASLGRRMGPDWD